MSEYEYFHAGSFCVYYGQDGAQTVVMVIERGSVFAGKSEGFGTAGGYIDPQNREQPAEAAVRELGEEIREPGGRPVIASVTPARLTPVASGIDYSAGKSGTKYVGNNWHGYKCELIHGEVAAMNADPDYATAAREACHNEVAHVYLKTPAELVQAIESGHMKFAYPHEAHVVLAVAKSLLPDPLTPHYGYDL
ncbi:MAG TPA: NUDIX domain-containing protein [Alphaproteobacteria bacterium]